MEYYPVESSEQTKDGWTRVTLVSGGMRWAATLLLRLGTDARKVAPEEVAADARELARSIAELYS